MLDAYIIERIRRERLPAESSRIPLQIEIPRPPEPADRGFERPAKDEPQRGVVIVDFSV